MVAAVQQTEAQRRLAWRKRKSTMFAGLCMLAITIALGMLAVLLIYIAVQGYTRVEWSF